MRTFAAFASATLAILIGTAQSAVAQSDLAPGETCRRGGDVRIIEVLSPGEVGLACDVRVTRDDEGGARTTTPYHANADKNFCRAMAAELASKLTGDGFACSTAVSGTVEAALAGGEAPASVAQAASPAPEAAPQAALETAGARLVDLPLDVQAERLGLPAPEAVAHAATLPENAADNAPENVAVRAANREPFVSQAPLTASTPALSLDGIVDAAAADAGQTGTPVVLTAGASPSPTRAPRPSKNGAGRLVGAQPSLEDIIDVSVNTAQNAGTIDAGDAGAPAAAIRLAGAEALAPRPTQDVIRGVLAANAAAWNEGNLGAFLSGYDDSDGLRLVADAEIAAGFGGVRKYYEAMITEAGAMGRLSFSNLDVSMTSSEVATVVGRYALESSAKKIAGAVTVVMKQVEGRWRIVQDTRIRDAAVPTLAPIN
ncbi:MAG: YybH family protein [Parvularculaceae bacterium]